MKTISPSRNSGIVMGLILLLVILGVAVVWLWALFPSFRNQPVPEDPGAVAGPLVFSRSAQEYLPVNANLPAGFQTGEQVDVAFPFSWGSATSSAGEVFRRKSGELALPQDPDHLIYIGFISPDISSAQAGFAELNQAEALTGLVSQVEKDWDVVDSSRLESLAVDWEFDGDLAVYHRVRTGLLQPAADYLVLFRINNFIGVVGAQHVEVQGDDLARVPETLLNYLTPVTDRLDKASNTIRRPCDCGTE